LSFRRKIRQRTDKPCLKEFAHFGANTLLFRLLLPTLLLEDEPSLIKIATLRTKVFTEEWNRVL
jgi:hypothetical protein